MSIFRFEYFTTYFTKKQLITLYEKNEEFKYDNAKQGKNSENNYN